MDPCTSGDALADEPCLDEDLAYLKCIANTDPFFCEFERTFFTDPDECMALRDSLNACEMANDD